MSENVVRLPRPRWWVISEEQLIKALRRAAAGENPDTLLLEYDANSVIEHVEDDGQQ